MNKMLEFESLQSHMFIKILKNKDSMYECIKIRQGLNDNDIDNSLYILLDWDDKSFTEINGRDLYNGIYNENKKIYEVCRFVNGREM